MLYFTTSQFNNVYLCKFYKYEFIKQCFDYLLFI